MGFRRTLDTIDLLVIHCAASPNGEWLTAEDIDRWHGERGFVRDLAISPHHAPRLCHIGYHFVLYTSGAVAVGRPLAETGAHARGFNKRSIATCLVGADAFTPAQWAVLAEHVKGLQRQFPGLRVVGHRDLSPDADGDGAVEPHEWLKTCPGFDVAAWLEAGMRPLTGHVLEASDAK